jgi:tetratricopeptide (TPR) repeat protein
MPRPLLLAAALLTVLSLPALSATKDATGPNPAPPKSAAQPAPPGAANVGEGIDNAAQYKHCVALARQKPEEGWEEALAWTSLGGGDAARHCGAIALIGLRQFEEGASRLEELATSSHADVKLRAGMLSQAGQAWLLAKNPERANAAQTAALKLVPDAPDLLVDRSQSLAEAKNYKEALADLNRALQVAPDRVDALTFRAAAKRFLDDQKGA